MNEGARNEARALASQLIAMIRRGDMSLSKQQELLEMANAQLARYAEALGFLNSRDPQNWTYEEAEAIMRIASGRADECVSRRQWDGMLRDHQLQLRADYVAMFEEGQRAFTEVRQELLSGMAWRKKRSAEEEERDRAKQERRQEIENRRKAAGQCVKCGRGLGFFRKLTLRDRHSSCIFFKE